MRRSHGQLVDGVDVLTSDTHTCVLAVVTVVDVWMLVVFVAVVTAFADAFQNENEKGLRFGGGR